MWPHCLRFNVAAITYDPLARIDLSKQAPGQPEKLWAQLAPSQKASLRRVVYEMKDGDVIYVKQGPKIIDRGVIKGRRGHLAYRFDSQFRIVDPYGVPWAHQVPVEWSLDFQPINILVGRAQQFAVEPLSPPDVKRLEVAGGASGRKLGGSEIPDRDRAEPLIEEAYYRESQARSKFIIPRHKQAVQWILRVAQDETRS